MKGSFIFKSLSVASSSSIVHLRDEFGWEFLSHLVVLPCPQLVDVRQSVAVSHVGQLAQ